jgi:hypothetical protein
MNPPTRPIAEQAALSALRQRYPWPTIRPAVPPIDWSLDGGGRRLVADAIAHREIRLVLEIGAFLGGSTKLWLAASPNVTVIALDPWEGSWANFAIVSGKPEHADQLGRPEGGYQTFLANLWADRERVVPLRGRSPEKLHELAELGVIPDLVYLDSDKSGVELELCHELFPSAILCGDDWTYGADEGYPIRQPVREFCRRHGRYVRTKMATWIIDRDPPPLSYRLRAAWRRLRGAA